MKKTLFALALTVLSLGRAHAAVPESFTPQNSAILLVDHQNLTVDWVKSLPRQTLLGNVRVLARLGSEMHIPIVITSTMEIVSKVPSGEQK